MTSKLWAEKPEVWRQIKGYEGHYAVSSYGRVKSLNRVVPHPRGALTIKERQRKLVEAANGYLVVSLSIQGKVRVEHVHILVSRAFHGPCPKGKEVLHRDGDRLNAHADNLKYGSHAENCQDTVRHGRSTVGEKNAQASITNAQARSIARSTRTESKVLALKHGTTTGVVNAIRRGTAWSKVV